MAEMVKVEHFAGDKEPRRKYFKGVYIRRRLLKCLRSDSIALRAEGAGSARGIDSLALGWYGSNQRYDGL